MTARLARLKRTISIAALGLGLILSSVPDASAWRTVFDPWNYRQNILTAVRSLTEINQQIDQLRNEAQMLLRMDLDLESLTGTVAPELLETLGAIQALIDEADAIRMQVTETDQAMRDLFPDSFDAALTGDDIVREAKARWDETLAAHKRAASLQAQISETISTDSDLLSTLLDRSRSASGNLSVNQAGNELTGLSVKQSLQLQQMMAAQYRAETFERARRMAAEEEARMRFQSFMGSADGAYTPGG